MPAMSCARSCVLSLLLLLPPAALAAGEALGPKVNSALEKAGENRKELPLFVRFAATPQFRGVFRTMSKCEYLAI